MLRKNKQFEQTMLNTRQIKQPNQHFVECGTRKSETVSHIISECEKLTHKEYKAR